MQRARVRGVSPHPPAPSPQVERGRAAVGITPVAAPSLKGNGLPGASRTPLPWREGAGG